MYKKGFTTAAILILLGLVFLGSKFIPNQQQDFDLISLGAPSQSASYTRSLLPFTDSTYNVGTSTRRFLLGSFDNASTTNLTIDGLDCTGNSNGGALTTDANGNVTCSDDDSGAGGGTFAWTPNTWGNSTSTTIGLLNGFLSTGSSTVQEIKITNSTTTNATTTGLYVSNTIDFNPISAPAYNQGTLFYNTDENTLGFYNEESEITLSIGEENWIRARNTTGSTITNGSVVYVSGSTGNRVNIALAQADADAGGGDVVAVGVATHDIENNSDGYITFAGVVNDIDTSDWSGGDELFVGTTTAGTLTNIPPTSPDWVVPVGYVLTSNPSTGSILVDLHSWYDTTDLTAEARNQDITGYWTFVNASTTNASTTQLTLTDLWIGGSQTTDFDGDGLSYSGTQLIADLGTSIVTGEITDGTILEADLNVSNSPTDNYVLSYNSAGSNFTWVEDQTGGGGSGNTYLDLVNALVGTATSTVSTAFGTTTTNNLTSENFVLASVATTTADQNLFWGLDSTGSEVFAVDSNGNASSTNFTATNFYGALVGNADTSTALAANGSNCAAGSYPLGVDASGAVESCTDATTEIDSAISTHAGVAEAHQSLVTLAGALDYLTLSGQEITRNAIDLAADVTGTLPYSNGGTGTSTLANYGDVLTFTGSNYQGFATSSLAINFADLVGTVDISDQTNLAGDSEIVLTDDTLSIASSIARDSELHDAVTVSGTPDYITLSGQDIVRGTVDIGDDTNLALTYPLVLTGDTGSIAFGTTTTNTWSNLQTFTSGISVSGDTITDFQGDGLIVTGNALLFDCSDVASTGLSCSGEDLINGITSEATLYSNLSDVTQFWEAGDTLSSGAISSGFGNIDIGSSNFDADGTITSTGVIDFGGATSFEFPNGSAPTVNAAGEIALNTDHKSISIATSTDTGTTLELPIEPPLAFSYASTTFTGTTTFGYTTLDWNERITGGVCAIDTGTAFIRVGDGTNWSNETSLSSATTSVTFTSNNLFNYGGEQVEFEIGTPASSPTRVDCKFRRIYERR